MSRKSTSRRRKGAPAPAPAASRREAAPPREFVRWLVPGLIALVTFAAFLPALHNQFVDWDDKDNFLDNPHYRGLGWPHLRWMWTTVHMGHWIPLTWMTLGLDYVVWGLKPIGYHLTSLLLHAANAVVFYFVARRLLRSALSPSIEPSRLSLAVAAAVAALLFGVHPLRVESVAWATERRDVLSGLFYLLTLLVYLRACERGRRWRGEYWAAVGLFACALLSKSMAVSLPVVLLILDVYPLRRLGGTAGWWSEPARRVYSEKLPFVMLAAGASVSAFLAVARLNNLAALEQLSASGRVAVSAYGLSFYVWKTIAPFNLSPLYELKRVTPWAMPFILSYSMVAVVTAIAWIFRRRVPGLSAAWLAYIVILLPVLGILQNGPQIAADRYTYLAGLCWALLAAAAFLAWQPRRPVLSTALAASVLLGLAGITWSQVQVWSDSKTLWTHTVSIDPRSSIAHNSLGAALLDLGKSSEGIDHIRQALSIRPDYHLAHYNWGNALTRQGRPVEASEHYRQALRSRPDYANGHNNWGAALALQGKLPEAIEHYQTALRLKPDFAEAHLNWGGALAQQGRLAEAVDHFRHALRIRPGYADAHTNWGIVLARQGNTAEAIQHYLRALQFEPTHAAAKSNLINAFQRVGETKPDRPNTR